MPERRENLRMYGGAPSQEGQLDWPWVVERLEREPFLWVTATSDGYPHPRPVWGVWLDGLLHVSIGTPQILRQIQVDDRLTVHTGNASDVVIIEGHGSMPDRGNVDDLGAAAVRAYDAKYDFTYDAAEYGPFMRIRPERVLAWRAVGENGREGFRETGKFVF